MHQEYTTAVFVILLRQELPSLNGCLEGGPCPCCWLHSSAEALRNGLSVSISSWVCEQLCRLHELYLEASKQVAAFAMTYQHFMTTRRHVHRSSLIADHNNQCSGLLLIVCRTCLELGAICEEVGLPPGVLNIVTGLGQAAGSPLSSHPLLDKVHFQVQS